MAWRKYGNRRYYYRQKRTGDTVRSEYIGAGSFGELAAALDERERMKRKAKQEQYRRMVKADRAIIKQVDAIGATVADIVKLVLILDGYHQHRRQWRKDRMAETIAVPMAPPDDFKMTATQLNALIDRVDAGNPSKGDRQALAECLHAVPALAAALGDTSLQAIEQMLTKMYKQPTVRQASGVHLVNMRNDFGYEDANALEKTLILHVVVCWYRLQYVEQ